MNEEIHYLYLITRDDGEQYVGVSKHPDRRYNEHNRGYGNRDKFKGRINKFEILVEGSKEYIYNIEDAVIKSYKASLNIVSGGYLNENKGLKGSFNGRAKLTDDKVLEIVDLLNIGKLTQIEIANKSGVSRGTISGILSRKNWTHITENLTLPPTKRVLVSEENRFEIRNLRTKGNTLKGISSILDIKEHTIYSHCRDIPLKKKKKE